MTSAPCAPEGRVAAAGLGPQADVTDLPSRWDVVVIGAGPAGAMAARELARRGRGVLLVERRDWPRDKICGGCLGGATLELLARSGLGGLTERLGAVPVRRLRLAGWGRSAELELPAGVALSRRALDHGLVQAAVEESAVFLSGTTAHVGPVDGAGEFRAVGLRRDRGVRRVRARVVLAAAGLGGMPSGGRDAPRPAAGSRVGLGTTLEAAPGSWRTGTIQMAVGAAGYVGSVRQEDGRWNLAAAVDPAVLRDRGPGGLVAQILDAAGLEVAPGLDSASWKGTPALTRRSRLAAPRLVAVGDAAGYVEPFTGEGILWALRGGLLAAPLVHRGVDEWSDGLEAAWRRTYHRRIRSGQRWCRRLAWLLARPTRARLAMSVVARLPRLAAPLVRELAPAPTTSGEIP